MKKQTKETAVFYLAFCTAALSVAALVVLVVAQTYVRWKLNQDFTFLGEHGLPSLAFVATVLTSCLAYSYREQR